MRLCPKCFPPALAVLFALTAAVAAQTTLPPNRPTARWDKLSNEIIARVVEQNRDMGGAVRFFKKATCSIEFSFLTSEARNPITGTFGYWFDDLNENGILTEDEVEVDLKRCSQPLMGYALKEVRRGIRDQTMTTTFNFFSLCDTKTVKQGDGYVMELKPVEGGRVSALLAFEKLYLTVSPDFRVTHIQTKTVDMIEISIDVKHGKIGPYTVRTGYTQSVEKPSGEKFIDDRSDSWVFVQDVPMISRVRLDTQISTIMGTITTRQEFSFENWVVEKRTKDVPIPGTEDYEKLFRGRITPDTPLVEVDGGGTTPPPPAPPGGGGGTPPGGGGGGVFEDDPPAGTRPPGGGVFEDETPPGGAEEAALRLGREVLAKLKETSYGWHRQPDRTYTAKCVLGATPEQAAVTLTATSGEGPVVAQIHDVMAYDTAAVFYGIRYGWFLAMDGPLYRIGAAPATWKAVKTAEGFALTGLDAGGTLVEQVKVGADFAVRERVFLVPAEGESGAARFRLAFETAVAEGLRYVMKVDVVQETPEGAALDARTFTYAWKRVGEVPFLKRITVETSKDGRPLTGPVHVTAVEFGP